MNAKKYLPRILLCAFLTLLCALTVGWIFSNSAQDGVSSSSKSEEVTQQVQDAVGTIAPSSPIATATGENFDRLHLFVRKSAHFLEYALLGMLFAFTLRSYTKLKRFWFLPLCLSFLTAATDEYIQNFSVGRTNAFRDVLIDVSGGAFGILFAVFCLLLGESILRKTARKRAAEQSAKGE